VLSASEPPLHEITETSLIDPVYELADYVEQHLLLERASFQPRDSVWSAAATLTDSSTITVVAHMAALHGRRRPAGRLYQIAATAGDPGAKIMPDPWASALRPLDPPEGPSRLMSAEEALRRAENAGARAEWAYYPWRQYLDGDRAGAADAFRRAALAGNGNAWQHLAGLLEMVGDFFGAEDAHRMAAACGRANLVGWAAMLDRSGDMEAADRIRRYGITMTGSPETSL
jgi:hypothetical protein